MDNLPERPIGTIPPAPEEEPETGEEFEEPQFGEPLGAEQPEEEGKGGPGLRLPKKEKPKPGAKPAAGKEAGKAAAGKAKGAAVKAGAKAAGGAAVKAGATAAAGAEAAAGPVGWALLAAQVAPYVAKYGKWIVFAAALIILLSVVTILIFLGVLACYIPGTCGGLTSTQAVNITQDKSEVTTLLASVGNDLAKNTLSADEAKNVQTNIQKLKELLKNNPEVLKKVEELEKEVNALLSMLTANKDGKATEGIKRQRERVVKIIDELIKQFKAQIASSPSAQADLSRITSAEINKILVKKGEKRAYFLDAKKNILGSAPVEFGIPQKPTPTGKFSIGGKEQQKAPKFITSTIYGSNMGHEWMQFDGARGFHGAADTRQDRLYQTAGCIRMFNRDLAIIYPSIKTGTEIEIVN